MSKQPTLWDTPSVTSLPEEDSGATCSDRQAGPTTGRSGREAAPAPALAQRAKGKGLQMLVTSGRNGFGSSASAALQQSLESRLMPRLDMAGSTLWEWTWRTKATPLRRRYCQRQALERRTNVTGFSSVPTPVAEPANGTPEAFLQRKRDSMARGSQSMGVCLSDIAMVAQLAAVPSPCTPNSGRSISTEKMDATGRTEDGRKHTASLEHAVKFASVATPRGEDSECAGAHRGTPDTLHSQANPSAVPTPRVSDDNMSRMGIEAAQREMNRPNCGSSLALDAFQAVTTPSARDWKDTSGMSESGVDPDGSTRSRLDQLPRQAQLAASGPTATGGTVETKSTGQLDPAYSRWLMGVPPEWDGYASTAMQSVSQRRKRSSKRTS